MTITPEHEYRFIDKSDWGPGPWQEEPDKIQWQDEATGLPCLAVRNPRYGHWCGYVGVAEGHPAFGLTYDEANTLGSKHTDEDGYEWTGIYVHGGLTFSDTCQKGEQEEEQGICHIPQPGQPDRVWWLGFDCCHAWDLMPGYEPMMRRLAAPSFTRSILSSGKERDTTYRTLDYIQEQCTGLARQLAEVAREPCAKP